MYTLRWLSNYSSTKTRFNRFGFFIRTFQTIPSLPGLVSFFFYVLFESICIMSIISGENMISDALLLNHSRRDLVNFLLAVVCVVLGCIQVDGRSHCTVYQMQNWFFPIENSLKHTRASIGSRRLLLFPEDVLANNALQDGSWWIFSFTLLCAHAAAHVSHVEWGESSTCKIGRVVGGSGGGG